VRRGRKSRKREEGSSNSRLKCPSGARETGIDNRENALYNPSVLPACGELSELFSVFSHRSWRASSRAPSPLSRRFTDGCAVAKCFEDVDSARA
jgi:hypothetical protein